jgi:hypothetical protein
VQFVFGYDAMPNLVTKAEALPETDWSRLARHPRYEVKTEPRTPRDNVKAAIVEQKEYLNFHLVKEDTAEFDYQPTACKATYRMVVLRKTITVERGQSLLYPQTRSARPVRSSAHRRCRSADPLIGMRRVCGLPEAQRPPAKSAPTPPTTGRRRATARRRREGAPLAPEDRGARRRAPRTLRARRFDPA